MATSKHSARTAWVSYLRVSTPAQADHALSIPGQRRAIEMFAAQHGQTIAREYVEPGCSGRTLNRRAFRHMLEDVLRPGSDIAVIVVHQTSRFSRDAAQARVVKSKLRRHGVRVVAVCQETNDDPFGQLIEGLFECIDQYESEAPYGYRRAEVELDSHVVRYVLVPDDREAAIVRELFELYVAEVGAKCVARALNQRGHRYRQARLWSKDLVLRVLDESAISGTYYWARIDARTRRIRPRSQWLPLRVEPIVEADLFELARRVRSDREPNRRPGRPPSPAMLLARMVRCAKCGAGYRLELSGKRVDEGVYKYVFAFSHMRWSSAERSAQRTELRSCGFSGTWCGLTLPVVPPRRDKPTLGVTPNEGQRASAAVGVTRRGPPGDSRRGQEGDLARRAVACAPVRAGGDCAHERCDRAPLARRGAAVARWWIGWARLLDDGTRVRRATLPVFDGRPRARASCRRFTR